MADPSSIHTSESLPFAAMYHLQTQSQRSNCSIFQNSSINRLSQYEESSNLICDSNDNCTTAGTSMNGVNVQIGSGYWEPESLVLPPSVALNRIKASSEGYGGEWNYNLHQQIAVENYGPTEGNRQKLDSFSDAFHGRGISRITNSGEQIGYNVQPNNSPHPHAFPSLSLPLVLSPPPTPLPPPSLSPPKRPSQSQNQTQSPSEGSLRFFPPPSCTGSILPGSFPPTHWLYLPTDASGNADITQQLPQDTSPSSVYPEGVEISLRQLSATDTDTSSCSPLTQHQPPISIPKLKQEHDAVTSEHHMTWSQMMQTSQPFSPLHHPHAPAEQLEVHEDTKPTSGFQQPRCLYLSSSQNTPSTVYTGIPFHSVLQSGWDRAFL
ncbi:uncharacterized protein LOC134311921 [Trichomycterus rosablanca]|uniref:uncharacterized protein LOC134311921 n=1 Tax=Trichomycterus rosablanca TaxID=2290929 RepID=UPI002F3591F8